MIRTSLRRRILLRAASNAAFLGIIALAFVRLELRQDFSSLLFAGSREHMMAVVRSLIEDLRNTPTAGRNALLAEYSARNRVQFCIFSNDAQQLAGPPIEPPPEVKRRILESPLRGTQPVLSLRGFVESGRLNTTNVSPLPPFLVIRKPGYWVGIRMPLLAKDEPLARPVTLILVSSTLLTNALFFQSGPWLAAIALALAGGLICWLPFIRSMTGDIRKMMAATSRIAGGDLKARTGVDRGDELGSLGISINRMTTQLEGYVRGQRRFLRDTAHELRSPLSRMQAALGVLERKATPDMQGSIQDLAEEIDLLSTLTGDLLALARNENRPGAAQLEPVDILETANRVVATENPTGAAEVRVNVPAELRARAHPDSLFRGISNIVRNAIRYAGEAGPVTLAANSQNGYVLITISDSGPGIPEEALEKVFTPFFRLDPSRDRKTGGTGLGMAIARSCVELCQGSILCRNLSPGLEVTITLRPL